MPTCTADSLHQTLWGWDWDISAFKASRLFQCAAEVDGIALELCYSKSGLRTNSIGLIWELIRAAESQAPPQACWVRTCLFNRVSRFFICSLTSLALVYLLGASAWWGGPSSSWLPSVGTWRLQVLVWSSESAATSPTLGRAKLESHPQYWKLHRLPVPFSVLSSAHHCSIGTTIQ